MGLGARMGVSLLALTFLFLVLGPGAVNVSSDIVKRTDPVVDYDGEAYTSLVFERAYKVQALSVYSQPVLKTWSSGFARRDSGDKLRKFGFRLIVYKSDVDYTEYLAIYPEPGTLKYYMESGGAGGGADTDLQKVKALANILCQVLTEYTPIPSFVCSVISSFGEGNNNARLTQVTYSSPEYAEVGVLTRAIGPCSASEGGLTAYFAPHVTADIDSLPEDVREEVVEDFYGWYRYYIYVDAADTCGQPYGIHATDLTVMEGTCVFQNTPTECSSSGGGGGMCPDPAGCDLPMEDSPRPP